MTPSSRSSYFSTRPTEWLTDEEAGSTHELQRGWFDDHLIAWPEGVAEFQLPYGNWLAFFLRDGFEVEELIHLQAPKDGTTGALLVEQRLALGPRLLPLLEGL